MPAVEVNLPHHRYEVRIEPGALQRLGDAACAVAPHEKAALIVDKGVETSHGRVAARSLSAAGYDTAVAVMPAGEEHKTLGTVRGLYEVMLNAKLERRSPVVALGGGITGDVAGFAAATYLRGLPLIQCPTTLLAMVDASIGGKTGVNAPQGKNLIGSFYQPALVLIDTDTLLTLPEREVRCGLAECVKHGVIRSAELFNWIASHIDKVLALDGNTMVELVERNVRIKAAVVMADEQESGERAHLNFGHTFAHAIEAATNYTAYLHGEAVSLGMVAATSLAVELGRCDATLLDRLVELLERIGLPTQSDRLPAEDELLAVMQRDKKVVGGSLRLVLPDRLGAVSIAEGVDPEAITRAWSTLRLQRTR